MKSLAQDTIFALSTTYGQSAIAVFRVSGEKCKNIAKIFCGINKLKDRYVNYTSFLDLNSNLIDKGIIIYFKSPRSYTGEDVLEIHTHGSIAIINKMAKELSKIANTRPALPGEFSKRAFLNGKGNMLYFEGINNLINSETEIQRSIANKQVYGKGANICIKWRERILEILAIIDAEIEFSDEMEIKNTGLISKDLNEICEDIKKNCENFNSAKNLLHGTKLLIVGPPNAGKSSLFNFLIQDEKMIISPVSGTTTDQIEQSIDILGQKVIVIDSAGIRDSNDIIEKRGVKKTLETLKLVNKIIIVLSPDSLKKSIIFKIKDLIKKIKSKNIVIVFNKSDLYSSKEKFEKWKKHLGEIKKIKSISISCKKSQTDHKILIKLYKFLHKSLLSIDTNSDDYYFSEVRQIECLNYVKENIEEAIRNIKDLEICANFLRNAMTNLDDLYGKHSDEKKLGIIFKNFCIGK